MCNVAAAAAGPPQQIDDPVEHCLFIKKSFMLFSHWNQILSIDATQPNPLHHRHRGDEQRRRLPVRVSMHQSSGTPWAPIYFNLSTPTPPMWNSFLYLQWTSGVINSIYGVPRTQECGVQKQKPFRHKSYAGSWEEECDANMWQLKQYHVV